MNFVSAKQSLPEQPPEVGDLVRVRSRRWLVEEVVRVATERSIWASTYAFFDGPKAFEVLAQRMDGKSDLQVTLLLNIQR